MLHLPFARIFIFADPADVRIFEQFGGGIGDAMGNRMGGVGIFFGDVVARVFKLGQRNLRLSELHARTLYLANTRRTSSSLTNSPRATAALPSATA